MIELGEAPNFLIIRLSAIGDTIHSLPLAAALRKAFPQCRIGWVVERPSAPLVENNPLIDWVRVLPKGWLKSFSEVRSLRRDLRRQRFEVVFDPQGLTKSAAAAMLSGTGIRIGFFGGEARELAPVLNNTLLHPVGRHVVDITLSLMRGIGEAVPERGEFILPPPTAADREALDPLLSTGRYRGGFVLMGPWGSFASKLWPLERFAELAERLREKTGVPSLMLGHGDDERRAAGDLIAGPESAFALAPDISITGVVELARRSRLFVGCDSFPMHAAAAVGRPTLGLFGITDPERVGPYCPDGNGAVGRAVFERITLVKSTRERRRLDPENMRALTVDKVLAACLELLAH